MPDNSLLQTPSLGGTQEFDMSDCASMSVVLGAGLGTVPAPDGMVLTITHSRPLGKDNMGLQRGAYDVTPQMSARAMSKSSTRTSRWVTKETTEPPARASRRSSWKPAADVGRRDAITAFPGEEAKRRRSAGATGSATLGRDGSTHTIDSYAPSGGHLCDMLSRTIPEESRRSSRASGRLAACGIMGVVQRYKMIQSIGLEDHIEQEKLASVLHLEVYLHEKQHAESEQRRPLDIFMARARELHTHSREVGRLKTKSECYCLAEKLLHVHVMSRDENAEARMTRLAEFWPRFHEDMRQTEAGCGIFPLANFPRAPSRAALTSEPSEAGGSDSAPSSPRAVVDPEPARRAASPLGGLRGGGAGTWKERPAASRCGWRAASKSGELPPSSPGGMSTFSLMGSGLPPLSPSAGSRPNSNGSVGMLRPCSKRNRASRLSDQFAAPRKWPQAWDPGGPGSPAGGQGAKERRLPKEARDLSALLVPEYYSAKAPGNLKHPQKSTSLPTLPNRLSPCANLGASASPTFSAAAVSTPGSRKTHRSQGTCKSGRAKACRQVEVKGVFAEPWLDNHKNSPFMQSAVRKYIHTCKKNRVTPTLLPFVTGHSQKLNASGRDLVDTDLNAIAAMIQASTVEALDLGGNALLSDKAISNFLEEIVNQLRPPSRLDAVNFKRCLGIGEAALDGVKRLLGSAKNLRHLDLSGVHTSIRAQLPLCKAISAHSLLCRVGLSEIGLSDNATSKLCIGELLSSGSIEVLDLGWNCFQADVFRRFGELLKDATVLRTLGLANCSAAKTSAEVSAPMHHFLEQLARAPYLKRIDLSLNRIDYQGSLVIEDVLETNNVLRDLDLSNNPLGIAGTRSILRLILRGSCALKYVNWESCDKGVEVGCTNLFYVANPGGRYSLDLEQPYDRAVLRMLYKSCQRLGLSHEAAFREMVSSPKYEHAKMVDGKWMVPCQGSLELTFTVQNAKEGKLSDVEDYDFGCFLERYYDLVRVKPRAQKVLPILSRWKKLFGVISEQRYLLDTLSKDLLVMYPLLHALCDTPEVVGDVVVQLLPSLVGGPLARHLTMLLLPSLHDALWVVKRSVSFFHFNPQNPTGHYRLDLSLAPDYATLERLLLLDQWEAGIDYRHQREDTSQRCDGSHMRNCRFKEQPLLETMAKWQLPETGHVEFDYVSNKRPPESGARELSEDSFLFIMQALRDSPTRAVDQVESLRSISDQVYVSSLQLREMIGAFDSRTARENCVVYFFHRLVDPQNDKIFRSRLPKAEDLPRIAKRLGYLTFFPYMQPEQARWSFDFKNYDERLALNLLFFNIASKENEANCKEMEYERSDGTLDSLSMGFPRSWYKEEEMPRVGHFRLTYVCTPEERNFDGRAKLLRKYGYWATDFTKFDVRWWGTIREAPPEVISYTMFLAKRYDHTMKAFNDIVGSDSHTSILGQGAFEASFKKLDCRIFEGRDEAQSILNIFRYLDQNSNGGLTPGEWGALELVHRELKLSVSDFYRHACRAFGHSLEEAWMFLRPGNECIIDEDTWVGALSEPGGYVGPARLVFSFMDKGNRGLISREEFLAMYLEQRPRSRILDFSDGLDSSGKASLGPARSRGLV